VARCDARAREATNATCAAAHAAKASTDPAHHADRTARADHVAHATHVAHAKAARCAAVPKAAADRTHGLATTCAMTCAATDADPDRARCRAAPKAAVMDAARAVTSMARARRAAPKAVARVALVRTCAEPTSDSEFRG